MNRVTSRRCSLGFTAVEMFVVLGIAAILMGQAVPSLSKMRRERHLRAVAESLASDLRFARSEAARTSESLMFRVSSRGANACYVLHTGARNDCDCAGGVASCRSPQSRVIKAEWMPNTLPVALRSNAENMEFQHRQGLVTQMGSIDVSLGPTLGIRQVIAITGRVRSCYIGDPIGGLKRCA